MSILNTPPLLIGAALLFWGWQSGLPLVGALMGVVIEGSRVVGLRWDFSEKDFRRLWDFTTFLFVATAIYLFTAGEGPGALAGFLSNPNPGAQSRAMSETAQAMLVLFRWAPMVFFLFVAAQAYSTTEFIPWSVFSLVLRRRLAKQKVEEALLHEGMNTGNRYVAICLLASCVPVAPRESTYPFLALLVGWTLWNRRSPRYTLARWAILTALALGVGFFAQRGFFQAAAWANAKSTAWLAQFLGRDIDPRENRTALGQVGRVKLSGKIALRLEAKEGQPVPPLLREASYRFFKFPDWAGAGRIRDFAYVSTGPSASTWELAPGQQAQHVVTIAQYLTSRGEDAWRGLLALPHGIVRLENLPAFLLSTNRLGVVRVDEGPGLVVYDAYYKRGPTLDRPPDRDDLAVPANEQAALGQVARGLHLEGKPTPEKLRAVAAFFLDHFQYSTWLPPKNEHRTNLTSLASFLLHTRRGHCEYFATAAVLLLRQAGVPARYAVGYSVHEKSGRQFIVRQRHAHAWCLAWVDGVWRDFDVTPPTWVAAEDGRKPWLEWISDAAARLWFEFSKWRWGQARLRDYLIWMLTPVLAVLLLRLVWRHQGRRLRRRTTTPQAGLGWPGSDSEFYQLEQEFARRGLVRGRHETPGEWLARLRNHALLAGLQAPMRVVLPLHYRYRFDPAGLDIPEREALKTGVQTCLGQLHRIPEP